jgi:GDP-4-dehydro-6-deoxy-D-mannose reductase
LSRRFIVTGGGGFVGQWLARALLQRGEVVCLASQGQRPAAPTILTAREWDAVEWRSVDVRDGHDVDQLIRTAVPDVIVHLAATSFVPDAERDPAAAYDVNVGGAVRVLHAALESRRAGIANPKVLMVGSGTQYGIHAPDRMPLAEETEQGPTTTYAATKVCQEVVALQAARSSGVHVICTRSFNHSGAGQAPQFLLPSLVTRARTIAKAGGTLRIGNDVVRDYLHVEDVVDAYLALVDSGRPGDVYNVCSGQGISVRELAVAALAAVGASAEVEPEPTLERSVDMPVLVGSPAKIQAATGWRPRRTPLDIIADLHAGA